MKQVGRSDEGQLKEQRGEKGLEVLDLRHRWTIVHHIGHLTSSLLRVNASHSASHTWLYTFGGSGEKAGEISFGRSVLSDTTDPTQARQRLNVTKPPQDNMDHCTFDPMFELSPRIY